MAELIVLSSEAAMEINTSAIERLSAIEQANVRTFAESAALLHQGLARTATAVFDRAGILRATSDITTRFSNLNADLRSSLELAQDPDFANVFLESQVRMHEHILNAFEPSPGTLNVAGIDPNSEVGTFSALFRAQLRAQAAAATFLMNSGPGI